MRHRLCLGADNTQTMFQQSPDIIVAVVMAPPSGQETAAKSSSDTNPTDQITLSCHKTPYAGATSDFFYPCHRAMYTSRPFPKKLMAEPLAKSL
jgi:hypothetical protein